MFYIDKTDDHPVWLILLATLIPDADFVLQTLEIAFEKLSNITFSFQFSHGDFHTIFVCYVISVILGLIISSYSKIKFLDAAFCIMVGFMAHLVEDAIVYNPAYAFLSPFSNTTWNMAIIPATNDITIWGMQLGSTKVFIFGFLLVGMALVYRWLLQGNDWLYKYNLLPHISSQLPQLKSINVARITLIFSNFKEYFK